MSTLVAEPQPSDVPYCYRLPRTDAGCTNLGHNPTVGLPCAECAPRAIFEEHRDMRDTVGLVERSRRVITELEKLQTAILETFAASGLENVTNAPSIASAIGPSVAVDLAATAARLRLFADQVQWQYDTRALAEPIR
ncbi:MAG: hypothetical protein ABIV25_04690 [Paracoccaceae bacterium]